MATSGEEAAAIATEFIQSLDNVPAEVQFLLAEMRERENRIRELQDRIQPRSNTYTRHVAKGNTSEKDEHTLNRIDGDFAKIDSLSAEKLALAKRLHSLILKHSNRLQIELARIQSPHEFHPNGKLIYPLPFSELASALPPAPEVLVYSGSSRTPVAAAIQTLRTELTPAPVAAVTPAPVEPIVAVSAAVSAAPSPSSNPSNKRRRLNPSASQASTSLVTQTTPVAPKPATRPIAAAAPLPVAPGPPPTPANAVNTRPRRAVSAAATVSNSTPTTEDKDEEMTDAGDVTGDNDAEGDADDVPYCFCQKPSYGEMVGCDNGSDCPYQWFHVSCVKISRPLPMTWYCDECVKTLGLPNNSGGPPPATDRSTRKRRR